MSERPTGVAGGPGEGAATGVVDVLDDLRRRGVELWFEGDRLRFRAPRGALGPEERAGLTARRSELVARLRAEAAGQERIAPLTFSQQSLWFLQQQAPESSAYHVGVSARILSAVDPKALHQALQALVDRHASLRTTYGISGGAPCQRVAGSVAVTLDLHQLAGASETELRAAVEADHRLPFDLERGPILRASLYTLRPDDHVLLVTVHHIAADGWSLMVLLAELLALHAEAAGGPPAALARPTVEYTDYAAWQEQALAGEEGERWWNYWREKLAPPRGQLEWPSDRERPAVQSFRGASVPLDLGQVASEGVRRLAREEGTTPFVILLAAYQALLFRLTGAEDVTVGTPAFGRSRPEFMGVVGDFVNPLALRSKASAAKPFRAFVAELRQTVLEALDAQEYPFPLLVRRLQPERDSSRSPIFDAFFVLLRFEQFRELEPLLGAEGAGPPLQAGGLRLAAFPVVQQEGQFDLALQVVERDGVWRGALKYGTDLFDEATASRFAALYRAVVEAAVSRPDLALGALPGPAPAAAREPVAALLERLRAGDVRLHLEGDRLKVNAPRGALDEATRAVIAARRQEIVGALRSAGGGGNAALRRISRQEPLPLSAVQQRLWFLDRMDPGRSLYNLGGAVSIRGPLDAGVLRRALDELVRRQESLRTRFGERDGAPVVEILEPSPALVEVVDLTHLPPAEREEEAGRLAGRRIGEPHDLARGPLVSYLLLRLAPDEHRLVSAMHHAVSDGWSQLIAFREICELYQALAQGQALPPALPFQYVDYAGWERERLASGDLARDLAYWRHELAGAPAVLELPTDRPRPAEPSHRGRRLRRTLDAGLVEAVRQLGRRHDATPFMTLLAGFQVLLHRTSGQDDVVVGTSVANRDLPELERVVGCFVDSLALRGRFAGNPTFAEALAQVRRTTLGAFDHRHVPFDVLVEGVRPERSAEHAPVFQVMFTLHSFMTALPAPAGLTVEPVLDATEVGARFDLSLELFEHEGELHAWYEYASDLFEAESIVRMHQRLERLLRAAAADAGTRVADLPMLAADDERLLLGDWNDTGLEHDRSLCLHQLLEASARSTPDAPAVVAGQAVLGYRALDERANRLARLLVKRGVGPGSLVAVCLDRTPDMPVALLAVLKAGAAYVPLDPTHPAERLRFTLEDAGVACAVTVARLAPLLSAARAPLVLLDEVEGELSALPPTSPGVEVRPEDRAYVIYTSGSTGRPKGVEVEHRNVVSFLESMRRRPGMTSADALLAVTTLSFDIAGLELWLPLCVGARVVIASRADALDGERLAALLEEQRITRMQATPATWRLLLDAGWAGKRDLTVLCGGEALPRDLAAALVGRVGELWNMYGPTETTIWSTLDRVEDPAAAITIGRPIHNTRAYVLEPSGQPAPIGVPGELCIAGEGVARGYHDRPELTAERFVTVALPGGRSERVYRTGDVARFRADGRLEFLGRRDHQVKVRGYRIELGEIEAVLASHGGVKGCVVQVREDTPGDARVVGYVVEEAGAAFDAEAARATLRARLPEYMVPNQLVVLAALPLTPNGKVDRNALPAPGAPARAPDAGGSEALFTPAQRRVAGAWREVLRADRVGLHDNFFDLGGHSLLLVKLHAALRREFEVDLELVELFQWTTVAAQAARLAAGAAPDAGMRRARARAERQTHG